MKPAPFTHRATESLGEAVDILGQHGDDAKVLAGGQSLIRVVREGCAIAAPVEAVNAVARFGAEIGRTPVTPNYALGLIGEAADDA